MNAKNSTTGGKRIAKNRNVSRLEHALTTYLELNRNKPALLATDSNPSPSLETRRQTRKVLDGAPIMRHPDLRW